MQKTEKVVCRYYRIKNGTAFRLDEMPENSPVFIKVSCIWKKLPAADSAGEKMAV